MRLNVGLALAALVATSGKLHAEPVRKLTLAELTAAARRSPKVLAARQAAGTAHALGDEAAWSWFPKLELTAVAGPGPKIDCIPDRVSCTTTSPTELQVGSSFFWRVDVDATAPLYTFGKISAATAAARAGARAAEYLADASEADGQLEVTKAYWGVKLARELQSMLADGREDVQEELDRVEKELEGGGGGDVTETDRFRLRAVLAEIDSRISEARKGERIALAGIRLLMGDPSADLDDAPLEAVATTLPSQADAEQRARSGRPEHKAALAGVNAAVGLAKLERSRFWPDLVLVGRGTLARDSGAADPANAYYNDPLNVTSLTVGIAAKWSFDATRIAKVHGAASSEGRARMTEALASAGVAFEAGQAWAEASDAQDRLAAAHAGEKAAHSWLVATLQSTSAGLGEPKDLADSLTAWFQMHARLLQATYDWNVAVSALARASAHPLPPAVNRTP